MNVSRPLWQGRVLALLGIVLFAFSLRSGVASLSPLYEAIGDEFVLPPIIIGLIGSAPPVCFAIFGLLTPSLERRFGLERLAVAVLVLSAIGLGLRAFSFSAPMLLVSTVLMFIAVGVGNVLLPPLVKKYFADRLGLMMTLYSTMMAISTFLPPLVAVPVADAAGWRVSLGLWLVFVVAALVPWTLLALRPSQVADAAVVKAPVDSRDSTDPSVLATGPIVVSSARPNLLARLWRIPLAWATGLVLATSSFIAYTSFAWMPAILIDIAGVTPAQAGALLSLFGAIGLPCALLVPILVVRWQATRPLFFIGAIGGVLGVLGLLFAPTAALPLWVVLLGMTGIMFPLGLVLMSVRARTHETAVALSGFAQSVAYSVAAIFPPLVGVIHGLTDGWQVPLILLGVMLVLILPAGWIAGRRRTVEDEWEARHGVW